MLEGLVEGEAADLLTVESVTAALLYLVSEDAPTRTILCAGAGGYSATRIYETDGIYLPPERQNPENIAAKFDEILNTDDQKMFQQGSDQTIKFVNKAIAYKSSEK